MKINVIELVPKGWNVENVSDNLIKINYKTIGRGNQPKQFVLPAIIDVDESFVQGIGLYLGDGKLSKDNHHLEFTSKDIDLALFMHRFFIERFDITDMFYRVSCRKLINDSLDRWAQELRISKEIIKTRESKRFDCECFSFQIGGKVFFTLFKSIVERILAINFSAEPVLRRALLAGLFAAEGSININRCENYIVYVGYHFSYTKEEALASLVQKLLSFEGITSRLALRKDKGERYLQITSWKNYNKCFKAGIFDICKRKRDMFLEKLQRTRAYYKAL
ncbi:hypothetical protein JXB27_04735 [Candidatus Woesearchaeota archaeon]|nr:hypothetical protein [Candidatus Woesearchaeota archaeon]